MLGIARADGPAFPDHLDRAVMGARTSGDGGEAGVAGGDEAYADAAAFGEGAAAAAFGEGDAAADGVAVLRWWVGVLAGGGVPGPGFAGAGECFQMFTVPS